MSTETSLLHSITRNKLYGSVNSKDQCSLHRWVLLKNSILSSLNLQDTSVSEYPEAISNPNEETDEEEEVADEEIGSVVVDAFMFPDAGNFVSPRSADAHDSEAQWLDSLLETLADDGDDDYPSDSEVHHSILPADEDDDQLLSPTLSPLASSEDLHQSRFYSPSVSVPYSTCFLPFDSPPLTRGYAVTSALNASAPSLSTAFEDALPYHDLDDIEDSSVPDTIEDVSDDESDTLSTPSFGRSITSLFLDSSANIPTDRNQLSDSSSPSFLDKHPRYLTPFELDPLPFRDGSSHHTFGY
ncbi:hypothetical protein AN958_02451 [Leucoagaricus sp. SymC.cos]|nr:hypothetical protein AN958_02451 [Leucoagaricus sp. SymC.cos]